MSALLLRPAMAADHEYSTPGPHGTAVVVGMGSSIYATGLVEATFAGTVTFDPVAGRTLSFGHASHPDSTIIFAPTSITNQPGDVQVMRLDAGRLRLGNDIARHFVAESALLQLRGGTFELAGSDQALRSVAAFAGSAIANNQGGTSATLTIGSEGGNLYGTIADGAGTLGLRIESDDWVTIAGNNTYSGGTTVAGGRLQVRHSNALGTGALRLEGQGSRLLLIDGLYIANEIQLGNAATALLTVDGAHTAALSGLITGDGDLVKDGFGTLRLENVSNTYRNTLVRRGTLVGNADTISGSISNAATVVFDQAQDHDGYFGGTIAGLNGANGTMIKRGEGNLTLEGASVLDWSVEAGALVASAELFQGNADVHGGASLQFNQVSDATYGHAVSGGGLLVKGGTGTLILTGSISHTGGTTIADGTLQIGNGGTTGSIVGHVQNSGVLAFNRSDDLTFNGVISGAGRIRQIGSGRTELGGNSSGFTGRTGVEAGTLAVNGQLGGTLDVLAAGRLQGTGTVGDTTVQGIIAPGNSIGTLNVAGTITFNPGSIYEVEVNAAGQSDRINASGAARIDGGATVRVLAGMGAYAPQTQYMILHAGDGRTGTFGGVTSNLAFLDPSLSYDANNVYLTMTRNSTGFSDVGVTPNQITSGGSMESLLYGNPVHDAVLNLSAAQARAAFDLLLGEIHASAKTALIEDSRFVRSAVNDRIRAAFDGVGVPGGTVVTYEDGKPRMIAANSDRFALWGQGFGSWGHTDGDGNAARLNRSTGGFLIGADAPVFDTWRFGAVAGYSHTSFDAKGRHSSGSSDDYHVGLYGGTQWGSLAVRTGAAYTWHDVSTSRSVAFPGFSDSLKGDYDVGTAQVFGELAYGVTKGLVRFEPFANLAYVNLHTDGFTEKGRAAALASAFANTDTAFMTLGLRASTVFDLDGAAVTARGTLGWRHAFGDVTPLSTMRFAGGGGAFSVAGIPVARDAAVVEAGLDFALTPKATLGVSYGGQFSAGAIDQSMKASFNVEF